jgi:CheY-like chemotaxis protein
MDGLEATRRIRRRPGTADADPGDDRQCLPGDQERCLQAGMNDFIPKPVRLEVLYAKLLELAAGVQPDLSPPRGAVRPRRR